MPHRSIVLVALLAVVIGAFVLAQGLAGVRALAAELVTPQWSPSAVAPPATPTPVVGLRPPGP